MTSAEQVSRMLALVPYLQRNPDVDLVETATAFAVSTKQLVKDLHVLLYCGLPEGLPGDLIEIDMDALAGGRIRLSNAEFLDRPMRFTPDEALSLLVALKAVAELADTTDGDAVATALAKLEAATGTAQLPKVALASGALEVREELAAAIAAKVMVELDYTDAGLEPSNPLVVPIRLIARDGYAYLQAWNLERADWRTYRLDRIGAISRRDQAATDPGEPPAFDAGWLESSAEARSVTLHLANRAAWITEYIPIVHTRAAGDHLEVELLVADPDWLRSLLLRLGADVLAVVPEDAALAARTAAADALAAYRAGYGSDT
jgi:proteasome accessory factor C